MHFGAQFTVDVPLGPFSCGVRYHYAGNVQDGKVLLVWFSPYPKVWRTRYVHLPRPTFESYLLENPCHIVFENPRHTLPEWLLEVEGLNFDVLEQHRDATKTTYRAQVETRLQAITPALLDEQKILSSSNPFKLINQVAYASEGRLHPHRVQTWFFSYVLYRKDIWALKMPSHRNGTWNRGEERFKKSRFGRPAVSLPACPTYSAIQMRRPCADAYLERADLGVYMPKIYRDSMIEEWGCQILVEDGQRTRFYHPDNLPFPSIGQFRYAVAKELGGALVNKRLHGEAWVRQYAKSEKGSYTRLYVNLLEGFEVDAYYVSERPRLLLGEGHGEPLAVARGRCIASGSKGGIGFSYGKEKGEAYRGMLFCMAVHKSYIAKIYGIPESMLSRWKMEGVPRVQGSDRGPAGSPKLIADLEAQFPIKTIKRSWSGQDNACAESGHPRDAHTAGAPEFVLSDSNVVELMKREILRTVSDNLSTDISNRLEDDEIHYFLQNNLTAVPQNLWTYREKLLRSDADTMDLKAAVRAYWTPVTVKFNRHGCELAGRTYVSKELTESGLLEKLMEIKGQSKDRVLNGYTLSVVTRYIWVEIHGELLELEATHQIRVAGEDLNVPLSVLEEVEKARAKLQAISREASHPERALAEQHYKQLTGHDWNGGKRVGGTPKANSDGRRETLALEVKGPKERAA